MADKDQGEELWQSSIHKGLESKVKIFGVEIKDILIALILSAMGNALFGDSAFAFAFVVLVPGLVLASILALKRGKPPRHFWHLFCYQLNAGFLSAGLTREGDLNGV